ncbi:DUF590 family protein [Heterostelium album PN500]|uniref:DUF590 family protein n=1 Tax=Heterostelium pallidum (strain ATCC 26659 / Pp 5 / PN500) TaxID=670386 RepID=D3B1R2_HETP5|nr:DUF590 family protein [Heterostelium album PN500]EFA85236.1 DUF590 family protein [Heterostelium album PN500]|eukprot:XP_020437345.1 DUF590 family protein [Heterostelium album PN500]
MTQSSDEYDSDKIKLEDVSAASADDSDRKHVEMEDGVSNRESNSKVYLRTGSEYIDYEDYTSGQRFLENMFGYTISAKKAAIPAGYTVEYTRGGQPFLSAQMAESVDALDIAAATEHRKHSLPMSCTMQQIEETFGIGIYLYFDFIWFCIIINVILLATVLVSFIPHLYFESNQHQFQDFSIRDYFFIAINLRSYVDERTRPFYFWSTGAAVILTFLMGPIYALKVHRYFKNRNLTDFEDGFEDDDDIKSNLNVTRTSRIVRFTFSYAIFVILLASSAVCNVYVLRTVNDHQFLSGLLTTSLVSSIVIRFFNIIYDFICLYLTYFEKHRTWTGFRNHNTLKIFVFKVINVLVLYLLRDKIFSSYTNEKIDNGCPLVDVGSQFLFILLLDLTLQNIWEIVYSVGMARLGKCIERRGKKSTDSYKPEFDLAEEYLEILYRQFIVYLGLSIYPMVTVFGVVCNIVEIYVDKFRMLKICRRPHRIQGSMKRFLTLYLFVIAVVAVATYPYGSGWVLVQIGANKGSLNSNCPDLFSRTPDSNQTISLFN